MAERTEKRQLLPTALTPEIAGWNWDLLATIEVILVGCGSIGRALALALASLGARSFTLVDPKSYRDGSVASQCHPDEVGRQKVDVVGEELQRVGVTQLQVFDRTLAEIEPGLLVPRLTFKTPREAIVIAAVDRLSGQMESIALAQMLRAPLLRVNLESEALLATVRCFDYSVAITDGGEAGLDLECCPVCPWSPEMIAEQESEFSCDGESTVAAVNGNVEGRSTQSPRALSGLTASWAALAASGFVTSDGARGRWHGREWLFSPLGPVLQEGILTPNPDCVGDHTAAALPIRVGSPRAASLADLAGLAVEAGTLPADDANLLVTGSGTRARGLVCEQCRSVNTTPRWLGVGRDDCGECPACGGAQRISAGQRTPGLRRAELNDVWECDLAQWGVPVGALVTLLVVDDDAATHRQDFLIGEESAS